MNQTTKILLGIVILAFIVWGIVSLSKPQPASGEPIRVGAVLPLSGSTASFYGEAAQRGLEIGKQHINAGGRISGSSVEIVYEDSQGQPKIGLQAFNKLIFEGFKVVIGDIISGVTLTMAPVAEQNKVLLIAPGSATPKLSGAGDYIFRTKVSAAVESKTASKFIVNDLGLKRISFLYQNSDYGIGVRDAMKNDIREIGGEILNQEFFDIGTTDARTQLTKLKSDSSELILIVGYPKEVGILLKQAKELNVSKKFFAHSGSVSSDIYKVAGGAADGLVFLYEISPDLSMRQTKNFYEDYRAEYSEEPELFSILAYDTVTLVKEKVEECSADAECIKASLYQTKNWMGVSGPISFDENGDIVRDVFTPMTIKNGQFVKLEQ